MSRIIVDDAVLAEISVLSEYTEVCDKSGKIVGYFFPAETQGKDPYEEIASPHSDEELDRREREEGGSSLAEIWQRLDPK